MTRTRLPNCRPSVTVPAIWHEQTFTVSVGMTEDGTPMEVFAGEAKGSLLPIIADACVSISLNLQCGMTSAEIAHSMGLEPAWVIRDGKMQQVDAPASPIGAILAAVQDAAEWVAKGCEVEG